jgi:hypothetical protein
LPVAIAPDKLLNAANMCLGTTSGKKTMTVPAAM